MTSYQLEHFQIFCDVVDNSFATITQDWVTDLNIGGDPFVFHMLGHLSNSHFQCNCVS
jgi:hypothetical protein